MSTYSQTSEERRKVVEAIQRRSATGGRSVRYLVRDYCISIATYHNWKRALRKQQPAPGATTPAFRPISVTALVPTSKPAAFAVVTPAGYRIKGLSVEEAAKLMGEMKLDQEDEASMHEIVH